MSEYGVGHEAGEAEGYGDAAGAVAAAVAGAKTGAESGAGSGVGAGAGSGEGESWFERAEPAEQAEQAGLAAERDVEAGSGLEGEPEGEPEAGLEAGLEAEPEAGLESMAVEEPDEADGAGEPDDVDDQELVEEYPDADPQQWISGLIADLERAEQGIGSGPRDVLMARIKLAQAYSELGDTVQAAPLAVANVAQAERLFPSSEGMLRQLREFRDAACEAAGWTAAMMRDEADEAGEAADEEGPSELVARPWPETEDPAAEEEPSEPVARPWPKAEAVAEAWPAVGVGEDEEALLGGTAVVAEPVAASEPEPAGAVIHEFVRRTPETEAAAQPAAQAATPPAELAIPAPPEPEYAEEVEPTVPAAELAAFEEIIRLRYELREAHRTIDRLKHVNRKLREALEFEAE
ncbi:hypothetical protein [Catenulispora subtropica]|uniref:Uncharacterized protein n=1 Tax=Catenulispora subtropica TaxID=450798 RepID=A0ABN2QHV8_9ACTN